MLQPWEQAILGNLFGWKRADGTRRFRELFVYVPRKNSKSTLIAGVVLYLGVCDGEPAAQIYSAAADSDQAALIFSLTEKMIRQDRWLEGQCKVFRRKVSFPDTWSLYEAIDAKASTKHGFNAHAVLFDEVHAQKDAELWEVLETSMAARSQPLMVGITTADFDRPSLCNRKLDYAIKVRDGTIDNSEFLPVIYRAERDDDWTAEATWKKANPNYGVSVKPDYIAKKCKQAQDDPTFENTFKRLHLNMPTEQATRWLQLDRWDASAGTVDAKALEGRECFGALDLSSTTDITAFELLFPDDDGGCTILSNFWVPGENAHQREKRDGVPYATWSRQGLVNLTMGDVIDFAEIRRFIRAAGERYNIRDIAMDRWAGENLAQQLTDDGFEMVGFGQGFASMSAPSKEFNRLVLAKQLRHGGNEVLRWMAGNVAVKLHEHENIKPEKAKSTERIDGIVAVIMAVGRWMAAKPQRKSIYENRKPMVLRASS